jgi:serpin B
LAQFPPKNPIPKTELLAADRPRLRPAGDAARTEALVRGLNGFAFDLYAAAAESDGNLIYSPYSIAQAFSMVYAGARGRTEAQMADVLGFLPQQRHHPAANALDRHLAALDAGAPPAGEEQGEAFALRNANAVWGQRGFPFEDAYLEMLAAHYGAGVRTVDFVADPEGGRRAVNSWVKDRTEGRIPDVVPQGVINHDTRLVLANAIYFKAGWLYPFEEDGTEDGPFTLLDGSRVTVPMMRQESESVPYTQGEGYQAVMLPYAGETVEMMVVVPDSGRFAEIEAGMNASFLQRVRTASGRGAATLTMPRFDVTSALDLKQILPGMGMHDAFRPGAADFSGIARGEDLFISAALHRATITADEEGTEATAATVIAIAVGSAPAESPPHLTIDRPFIFSIVDRETGAILFLGRVTNPAA